MTDAILGEDVVNPDNGSDWEKRYNDSQSHIKNLESELAEIRNEMRGRTSLEELVDKIAQKAPPVIPQGEDRPVVSTEPVDIEAKVRDALRTESEKAKRDANLQKARSLLSEKYGADYNTILAATAKKLGVANEFIATVGAQSPEGLLELVENTKAVSTAPGAPPASSVDTSKAFGTGTKRGVKYYSELRKKDRNAYFSSAVQRQMHDDAILLGEDFYSN